MLRADRRARWATAGVLTTALIAGCASDDSPTPSGSAEQLEVEIADGNVTPNAERVEVAVGTTIEIIVTSDIDEELHLHGYDLELAVEPGEPATVTFDADQTGRFEIETHETDTLVYQLIVTP